MIRIWNVEYVSRVDKGKEFRIGLNTLYFTFPFRTLYIQVEKDGEIIFKRNKKIWFFIGLWKEDCFDIIYDRTEYKIECGYVIKNEK